MCIIGIYNSNNRPTLEKVRYLMNTNRDGAGVAYSDGKNIIFRKGYTNPEAVYKLIKDIPTRAKWIVLHARIGTSGGINAQKCHPFPLTNDPRKLDKTAGVTCAPIVFHNGIFRITNNKNQSDSQTFISNALYPVYTLDPDGLKAGKYNTLLNLAIDGNRVLLCYPDKLVKFGTWHTDPDSGAQYSNSNYKPFTYYAYDGYTTSDGWKWDGKKWEKKAIPQNEKKPLPLFDDYDGDEYDFDHYLPARYRLQLAEGGAKK